MGSSGLGINKNDYITALRGRVNQKMMFLPKRNCNEILINNYNPKILNDDPSNQDIQIIAGEEAAFAVATYTAKYISKDESGQSKMLKRIEEDSRKIGDSTDLKLKKLGKVLEDTREVSMQEVIFRLFGYSMCCSSRKKMFIQTLPPEKRDGLIKPNIEELDDMDDIFCYNIIDYYQNRPDSLEDISLASFAANYEYYKYNTNTIQIQDDNIQEDDNNEDEENITEQTLLLKNNMGYLKERKKSAIIRYFKGKYDDDITRIRCVMLLFHPFRNELLEVHNNEKILEKYNENKELVQYEQSLFEPHPEFLDFVENLEQEIIEEDEQHEEELDNEFVEEDTTRPEEVQDWFKKQGKVYEGSKLNLEDKKKLNKRINTLNIRQRKILDELMDIDDEKQYFLYLYGQAGTGKTYLLNTITPALEFKSLKSGVDLDKPLILVMSPTASAAKHLVYGDTIHGALKINGFNNLEKQLLHGANATLSHDLSQVKHVIIDEISMVGANFFLGYQSEAETNNGISRILLVSFRSHMFCQFIHFKVHFPNISCCGIATSMNSSLIEYRLISYWWQLMKVTCCYYIQSSKIFLTSHYLFQLLIDIPEKIGSNHTYFIDYDMLHLRKIMC